MKYVKNIKGSSKRKCSKCSSWIKHWEKNSGKKRRQCCVYGCKHKAQEGAHVITARTKSKKEYIVPTCSSHNPPYSNKEFRIVKETKRVPAIKCKCRKRRKKATA